jgi:hypothetical protein
VFLATAFMDEGGLVWTERVQWAAVSTRVPHVVLPWEPASRIALPDGRAREALGERARHALKGMPDDERRAGVAALIAALGVAPPRARDMMTWDEVRATMDLTVYGGHTHNHPILTQVEAQVAEREIRTCRDRIAAETGVVPHTFAYPNGDHSPAVREMVVRAGFTMAFSTDEGIASQDTDWSAIKRLPGIDAPLEDFVWSAAGLARATAPHRRLMARLCGSRAARPNG